MLESLSSFRAFPMQIILFEDALVDQLAPVTIGRPAFAISCAGWRLDELIRQSGLGSPLVAVRPHLHAVQAADAPDSVVGDAITGPALLMNGRLAPTAANLRRLETLPKSQHRGLFMQGERIVAALVARACASRFATERSNRRCSNRRSRATRSAISRFSITRTKSCTSTRTRAAKGWNCALRAGRINRRPMACSLARACSLAPSGNRHARGADCDRCRRGAGAVLLASRAGVHRSATHGSTSTPCSRTAFV